MVRMLPRVQVALLHACLLAHMSLQRGILKWPRTEKCVGRMICRVSLKELHKLSNTGRQGTNHKGPCSHAQHFGTKITENLTVPLTEKNYWQSEAKFAFSHSLYHFLIKGKKDSDRLLKILNGFRIKYQMIVYPWLWITKYWKIPLVE